MNEEEINKIMEDITEDSNLCIIRDALENYEELDEFGYTQEEIKEIEEQVKDE